MKTSYFILFLFYSFISYGQLQDSFDDLDFHQDPRWQGDSSFFIINDNGMLQADGPAATSVISLSTENSMFLNTEWSFYIRMDFNPSSSNYVRVYLMSDQANLKGPLNGYYLKIGGASGNVDAIDLYRQQGTTLTKLTSGIPGRAGKTINSINIKVIRDHEGTWKIFSDIHDGQGFVREGNIRDTLVNTCSWFGISCYHTATRNRHFFFDDFLITEAPLLVTRAATTGNSAVKVFFNKDITGPQFLIPSNYTLSQGMGNPSHIEHLSAEKSLLLHFPQTLKQGDYVLYLSQTLPLPEHNIDFYYIRKLSYGEMLITEILPDPNPPVSLPQEEFIEIYNTTGDTIQLDRFTFSDLSTTSLLPAYSLPPRSYLILCPSSAAGEFSKYGPVLGLSRWPSLNNGGDELSLRDRQGDLLHKVSYTLSWYGDNVKKDGGWSLEMIDPENICGEEDNWIASEDPSGGTPARDNSVLASKPDQTGPELLKAEALNDSTLLLFFNETLDSLRIYPGNFSINPHLTIKSAFYKEREKAVTLIMSPPLQPRQLYSASATEIYDCNGNRISEKNSAFFALPEKEEMNDIILNEILFNPFPGGVDFVEIYNHSEKYINLNGWKLANAQNGQAANARTITTGNLILAPGQYLALTRDPDILINHYPAAPRERMHAMSSLPSYPNKEGTVVLLNDEDEILDWFDYHERFHLSLIEKKEGISLERISFSHPSNSPENWHSAAGSSGYATPGYRNSQFMNGSGEKSVFADPKIFSPDEDGYKDFTLINYRFDKPGHLANVTVIDQMGREIRKLARNELLGTEGFFRWDGTNEELRKCRSGYYLILFEIFSMEGFTRQYKETVVLSF